MNIGDCISYHGDGKYTIIIKQKIYFDNVVVYNDGNNNIDFLFEFNVKNGRITYENIYMLFPYNKKNKIPILYKVDKDRLKESILRTSYMERDIKKFNYEKIFN